MDTQPTFHPRMLTVADVQSVYSGRANTCCCGCAGNHRYPSGPMRLEAGTARGYEVTDDEVSDREVKRVLGLVQKNWDDSDPEYCPDSHCSVVVGKRVYIVYLSAATRARLPAR